MGTMRCIGPYGNMNFVRTLFHEKSVDKDAPAVFEIHPRLDRKSRRTALRVETAIPGRKALRTAFFNLEQTCFGFRHPGGGFQRSLITALYVLASCFRPLKNGYTLLIILVRGMK